jgi:geranylgeranyl reductase family protein
MLHDVIVVGGGPAGSSAARRCSQLGMDTLLLDQAVFPRDKLCGGAVSLQAIKELEFELPAEIIEREIFGARIHFKEVVSEIRIPARLAILVNRAAFDHFLLNKAREAGVKVLDGSRVESLDNRGDSIEVISSAGKFSGRMVIGCDGFNSVIARYVRRPYRKNEYGICIETKIPATEEELYDYIENAIDVHFNVANMGYGWVFPHRGYFYTGIGGVADRLVQPGKVFADFLSSTGLSNKTKLKGFPIPTGGIKRTVAADRLLLAGDAAGFVDPLTGEGIAYAIRSGHLSAEVASASIKKGKSNSRDLALFGKLCEEAFGKELRYSWYLSKLIHSRPNLFIKTYVSEKTVLEKYLEVIVQKSTYQKLFWWLMLKSPFFFLKPGKNTQNTV